MDFEKSKDEKDLIEKKMLEIDKLMVKRIRREVCKIEFVSILKKNIKS